MYRRQSYGIGMKARYGGMGERPPEPHTPSEFQKHIEKRALEDHEARVAVLIADLIQDEGEAIRKYEYLLKVIDKSPQGYTQGREIVAHIRQQETAHVSLLKRLVQ